MATENFQKFYKLVLENLELQNKLKPIIDRQEFIDKVLVLGNDAGFEFSREDVEIQMRETRKRWIERWI